MSQPQIPVILASKPRTIPALNDFCDQFDRFVTKYRNHANLVELIETIVVSVVLFGA